MEKQEISRASLCCHLSIHLIDSFSEHLLIALCSIVNQRKKKRNGLLLKFIAHLPIDDKTYEISKQTITKLQMLHSGKQVDVDGGENEIANIY